ncbi:restriction endonuclease subunit S [Aeromonas veronii]|uniref:restriction endonuclease subunit S n=1 Tax=Aeromonas veronii TaxID=654 RepID=UPI003005BDB4
MIEQLITDHLDLWSSAVRPKSSAGRGSNKLELTGIKKLRELILELAVRGKLVTQDPNDEPASVLLERIAAEKARLVKEGKIKKPKPLPEITDDEKPFELPDSWCWARLQDIADYNGRPNIDPSNIKSDAWLLDLEDIEKDTSRLIYRASYAERESKSNKSIFKCGDVLYSKLRPYLNKVIVADIDGICTTEIVPITPTDAVGSEYLKCLLKSPAFLNYVNSLMYGVKMPRLGTEDAIKSVHPLPPLEEQHRIVAKVDELMSLCDQLEQQSEASLAAHQTLVETLLATLTESADSSELAKNWARLAQHFDSLFTTQSSIDALKQTILQLAVMGKLVPQDPNDEPASALLERIAAEKARLIKEGKIKKEKPLPPISEEEKLFALPDGWQYERVGTFCLVGTGATPSRTNNKYWESATVNWVSSGETSDLFVSETNEKISALAVKETNVTVYPVGTLIVAMYGQGKTRGQITELLVEAGTNQACAAIVMIEKSENIKNYIKIFFRKAYSEIREQAAGGAQPNLNVGKISTTVIPIPPIAEQHRIVTKVEELMSLCDQLSARLQASQTTQLHLAEALVEGALN